MPRPKLTCMENFVKTGRAVFEICQRTDRRGQTDLQTDTFIAIPRIPTGQRSKMRHK